MTSEARITTHGKAAAVPSEWIPHTRAEISESQRQCAEEKERQREANMQKKQVKKERQQQAKKKVTAQEDANAREGKEIQSMCPDLDMKRKGLPPPSLQAHAAKPFRKKTQPVGILPQVETPVILSPSNAFADIDRPNVDFGSSDELPPISSVATSKSEGIIDETMDMDIISDSKSLHMGTQEVMDDDDIYLTIGRL